MAGEFPTAGLSAEARRALEVLLAQNQALVDEFCHV